MPLLHGVILFFAAVSGGALNSVAGGGSFLTFPALLFLGVPPITANATSTVALWPGAVASAVAYRREWVHGEKSRLIPLSIVSLIGGFLGAKLLLGTPESTFSALIPWLLLAATLVFIFGGPMIQRFRAKRRPGAGGSILRLTLLGAGIQLAIATYGGYFSGGIGILMLAALTLAGMENLHAMNGLKNWLTACINGIGVIVFTVAGAIYWVHAAVMILGAIAGGYGGAAIARRVDPKLVRRFVILVGVTLTIYFFVAG